MYKYLPSVRQSICDTVLVDIDLIMFHQFSGMYIGFQFNSKFFWRKKNRQSTTLGQKQI